MIKLSERICIAGVSLLIASGIYLAIPREETVSLEAHSEVIEQYELRLENMRSQLVNLQASLEEAEAARQFSVPENLDLDIPTYNLPMDEDLQVYLYTRCIEYDIVDEYEWVLALIWAESNFNPTLISKTNDHGLMQINQVNHGWLREQLGIVDFLDPYQNIEAGVVIISTLIHKYDNMHMALMAYNYGEGGARRHWNQGTYSSSYSRSIEEKRTIILSNEYGI